MAASAFFKPARSRAASPGPGGPKDLDWRYGKSQRSTVNPVLRNVSARATRSGAVAFEPAPWANTRASPLGVSGRWGPNSLWPHRRGDDLYTRLFPRVFSLPAP